MTPLLHYCEQTQNSVAKPSLNSHERTPELRQVLRRMLQVTACQFWSFKVLCPKVDLVST